MNLDLLVRPALDKDHQQIGGLIHFERYVHRHLDWRTPLDWLDQGCFWIAERNGRAIAAMACPDDPAGIHWLRLFACTESIGPREAWFPLWKAAQAELSGRQARVAVIVLHDWMESLLRENGFSNSQHIVLLDWNGGMRAPNPGSPLDVLHIRRMAFEDLPAVARVDELAFAPLWRNSLSALQHAFPQAAFSTVVETEEGIIGYQMTTHNPFGAHLARLAVHPSAQKRGLGQLLVNQVIDEITRLGLRHITVNTQSDNAASLALYHKVGFRRTHETYSVYVYDL